MPIYKNILLLYELLNYTVSSVQLEIISKIKTIDIWALKEPIFHNKG